MATLTSLWNDMSQGPLLWLTVTLSAYCLSELLWKWSKGFILFQPILISSAIIIAFLLITRTSYQDYFKGAYFIYFLLGPATVALGIPLYENRHLVRGAFLPILVTLLFGTAFATVSTLIIAQWLGAPTEILISLAPKSITTPVAMAISKNFNGDVTLTAVAVVITGLGGSLCIAPLMKLFRIKDRRARGLATGIACHGTGTAFAFQHSQVTGSFSSLGMGLSCVVTSLLIPPILSIMGLIP